MNGAWVDVDVRDEVVDFARSWAEKANLKLIQIITWVGLHKGKFYDWQKRYGKVNTHNSSVPRDHWISEHEKQKIVQFHFENPLNGYRRLAYMMIDQDIAYASPATVYRILKAAGLLDKGKKVPSAKGQGFLQPTAPHQHWHVDVSYLNLGGTFYYLCSILDGYSRYIVHWELREQMTEMDVEQILEKSRELYYGASPRVISDNGPQFIARDFKNYVRLSGMTHVRTSPYYPQSNGKIERWHRSLKETIRPQSPRDKVEALALVGRYVKEYNQRRLHSALGYVTPHCKLMGHEAVIYKQREDKLAKARQERINSRKCEREMTLANA